MTRWGGKIVNRGDDKVDRDKEKRSGTGGGRKKL